MTSIHLYETFGIVRNTRTKTVVGPSTLNLSGIYWLNIGCASGQGARPFQFYLARNLIREFCRQRVAFFVQQVGPCPGETGTHSTWIVPRAATWFNGRRIGFVTSRQARLSDIAA